MVESTANQEEKLIDESKSTDIVKVTPAKKYSGPIFKELMIIVEIKDVMKQGRPFDKLVPSNIATAMILAYYGIKSEVYMLL